MEKRSRNTLTIIIIIINLGDAAERHGGMYMGLSERHDAILS